MELKSRGYQDEIFKKCIQQNTIVYLPTGAGKTFIAVMVMKHFAVDLQKYVKFSQIQIKLNTDNNKIEQ